MGDEGAVDFSYFPSEPAPEQPRAATRKSSVREMADGIDALSAEAPGSISGSPHRSADRATAGSVRKIVHGFEEDIRKMEEEVMSC